MALVSLSWRIDFAVECYEATPDDLNVRLPKQPDGVIVQRLEVEADEAWSFVGKKTSPLKVLLSGLFLMSSLS